MRITNRLDKYMPYRDLNDNQVSVNCGMSVGLLGKARQGKSDVGKKAIEKLLNYYQDVNRIWLLTGEGEMLKSNNKSTLVDIKKERLIRYWVDVDATAGGG